MYSLHSYHPNRRFQLAREAVVPFAVGLLLVASGIVCGFIIAAMTGSLATPTAAATAVDAIEVADASRPGCGAAAPVPTRFGFLVFEQEDGLTLTGFGPLLPGKACVLHDPVEQ